MPRVAVVVPCFNDGGTLSETLASLRNEEEHELVVVDDGSDDPATLETLSHLTDAGTTVVRRENGGLSAARMSGVEATGAPYVFPLDADDAVVPGALGALADALDAAPEAALAWGDIEVWGEIEAELAVARSLDPWLLTYLNDVPVAALVRRPALAEAGGWSAGTWAFTCRGRPCAIAADRDECSTTARRSTQHCTRTCAAAIRNCSRRGARISAGRPHPCERSSRSRSSRPCRSTRSPATASICS